MAKRVGGIARTLALQMIPGAIKAGFSASGFLEYLKRQGLGYRRTLFLADWRSVLGITKVEGLLKYERRNIPIPTTSMADVNWKTNYDYMYRVKVWVQATPGAAETQQTVNLWSDKNLTPSEIEQQIWLRWGEWEKYSAMALKEVQAWTAYHVTHEIEIEAE